MFRRRILIGEVDPTLPRDGTDLIPLQFAFSHSFYREVVLTSFPATVTKGRRPHKLSHPPFLPPPVIAICYSWLGRLAVRLSLCIGIRVCRIRVS